jgi:L-iditol 2-dehydrogenase
MNAAVFHGPNSLKVAEYGLNKIGDDDVLLKVEACGICGTDFHIYKGEAPARAPLIIGHEYAGEIVQVGKNVIEFKEGDKAAINPNIHCGHCEFCKEGKINLCKNLRALGVTMNGGLAQYSIVPSSQVYVIRKDFPIEQAAFAEPLSCCVHGINQSNVKLGNSVAVLGAGTIGLMMLQLVQLSGVSKVIVVEPNEVKRNIAIELKADFVLNPLSNEFNVQFLSITNGGADIVIECVGNSSAAKSAFENVKKGGTIVLFGLSPAHSQIDLDLQMFFHKELNVKGSLLNPFTFQTAIDLLTSGKVKVDTFNLNRFSLDESQLVDLFQTNRQQAVVKNMVFPNN